MQTVTLTGATANGTQFTLTFNGSTTAAITYTGTTSDLSAIQSALMALPTIGGVGGLVSVTQAVHGVHDHPGRQLDRVHSRPP